MRPYRIPQAVTDHQRDTPLGGDSLWHSFALVHLTGEPLDRSRGGHDRDRRNRQRWLDWWKSVEAGYTVPEEKPNATFMPGYPVGSPRGAKWARDWLERERWTQDW